MITYEELHVKGPFLGALPRFAAVDPALTLTVPLPQVMSGAFDSLSHCMETYFGTPRIDNASDDMNLAIQKNIIAHMRATLDDPADLWTRSELVYDSVMGENGVLKIGKVGDFQAHMIQHQYGAYTHTNHGFGLAVIHPALYRHLAPAAPEQSPAGHGRSGMSPKKTILPPPWPASTPSKSSSLKWACPPASPRRAPTPLTTLCAQ